MQPLVMNRLLIIYNGAHRRTIGSVIKIQTPEEKKKKLPFPSQPLYLTVCFHDIRPVFPKIPGPQIDILIPK